MPLTNNLFLLFVWNIHILNLSLGVDHMTIGDLHLIILAHHAMLEPILVAQSIHLLLDVDVIQGMYFD